MNKLLNAVIFCIKNIIEICLRKSKLLRKLVFFLIPYESLDELFERHIVNHLLARFKANSTGEFAAVDIGAGPPPNYYEIFMKYTTKVFCVEPVIDISDNNYSSHVKKLLKYSRNNRISLYQGVISDINGLIDFYRGSGNSVINSSIEPEYRLDSIDKKNTYLNQYTKITVNSKTYYDYIADNNITNLVLVKIDAEGSEDKILQTMNKGNAPQILLLEVAYDTGDLKNQIRRLVYEENIFKDNIIIVHKDMDEFSLDLIGNVYFNKLSNYLNGDINFEYSSIFLMAEGIIGKEDILKLKRILYSHLVSLGYLLWN